MTRRILCVDDEENILKALERNLRSEFAVDTALGASEALEKLAARGPAGDSYAVVVSDLRMPGMDGIQFLSEVRRCYPDTVRLILSGNADLTAAIAAVNEGNIFQFLTKPSSPDRLRQALNAALKQYELIIAERELLEETLNASVAAMMEVLSLANPVAFGRAARIRQYVKQMAHRMGLVNRWQFDVAAMLSQLGCIAVPGEILEKINGGIAPTKEEKETWTAHPSIGSSLLARIPRMETVAAIVRHQMTPYSELQNSKVSAEAAQGAQMLSVSIFLDGAVNRGMFRSDAVAYLRTRPDVYDPSFVDAIEHVELAATPREPKAIYIRDLQMDMIINQEIWTKDGLFVTPKGQPVSMVLFARLKAFSKSRGIPEPISVLAPVPARKAVAQAN
jgi:CheY-like chemotaxis protein